MPGASSSTSYNDGLVAPPLGATRVQAAVDALKSSSASMFIYPNRVDCSVNSGRVDNLYSAAPVLHTQTSGNVGGGFNDLLKIGNKSILGFRTANLLGLGTWSGFQYTWRNLSPAGSPFDVYTNLVVDINGNDTVYKIFVMDPNSNPVLDNGTTIINGDGSKTFTHVAGVNHFLVVNDLSGVVPAISLGANWWEHGYALADVLAVYPAARLREASSGDNGMPVLTPTPAFMLVTGDSNNNRVHAQRLTNVQFNGIAV